MGKTNLNSFLESYMKCKKENMIVLENTISYHNKNKTTDKIQQFIVVNEKRNAQYIVNIDDNNNIINCNCPHYYWRGKYKDSTLICKHMMRVSEEYSLNIHQLGNIK